MIHVTRAAGKVAVGRTVQSFTGSNSSCGRYSTRIHLFALPVFNRDEVIGAPRADIETGRNEGPFIWAS
jgi:hypothetical protein